MPKRSTLSLTKRIVEKLKAKDNGAIYWDRELTGFGVKVHAITRCIADSVRPACRRP